MADFPLHTADSAPDAAQANLKAAEKKMGFLPNIFAKMAEAPALLEAYRTLDGIDATTSLSRRRGRQGSARPQGTQRCQTGRRYAFCTPFECSAWLGRAG